jgi:hypothetical protein
MKIQERDIPKGNALFINRLNKIRILGLNRETGTLSRANIVSKSGLSAPTVTRIVNSLINEEKLVVTFAGLQLAQCGCHRSPQRQGGLPHYIRQCDEVDGPGRT